MVPKTATEARTAKTEAEAQVEFADAALALASHQVTDPVLNDLIARQARGELSGDEAREMGLQHILGH